MRFWNLLPDPSMWSGSIEVLHIGAQHPVELPFVEDEQVGKRSQIALERGA